MIVQNAVQLLSKKGFTTNHFPKITKRPTRSLRNFLIQSWHYLTWFETISRTVAWEEANENFFSHLSSRSSKIPCKNNSNMLYAYWFFELLSYDTISWWPNEEEGENSCEPKGCSIWIGQKVNEYCGRPWFCGQVWSKSLKW